MFADELLSRLDRAAIVVTARAGDERAGCLVGFSTQCSIRPARLLVCLSILNETYRLARRSFGLAVHLLGSDQGEAASIFGEQTGDRADKWAEVRWRDGLTGAPVLLDCAAWLEGAVLGRVPLGDHEGFLLDVRASGSGERGGSLMLSETSQLHAGHPISEEASPGRRASPRGQPGAVASGP